MTKTGFSQALLQVGGASPSRQAALYLHGLHATDRLWLLEQLDPSQRATLTTLLAELIALGLPSTAAQEQSAAPAPSITVQHPAPVPASPKEEAAARIMRTSMREVVDILRLEPDALVARVIKNLDPSWSGRFLAHLDLARRTRLAPMLRRETGDVAADVLDQAVLQAVSRRVGTRTSRRDLRSVAGRAMRAGRDGWKRLLTASRAPHRIAP